jgi:hypothetical protein
VVETGRSSINLESIEEMTQKMREKLKKEVFTPKEAKIEANELFFR